MGNADTLNERMAQIGKRYLTRTLGELQKMQEFVVQAGTQSQQSLQEIEQLAHKIHGSGAMFGFHAVSEQAGDVEHIAAALRGREAPDHLTCLSEPQLQARLRESLVRLHDVTRAAALQHGLI